jgi:predicted metal-dependent phosphoesterase TrpH
MQKERGVMTGTPRPLLCELHAHTSWSDGALSVPALVDLYGSAGFDVLAITDHVLCSPHDRCVHAANYGSYLVEVEAEGERARARYGLLVLPGLELTYDDPEPALAAHALALGLRSFVGLEDGLEQALARARGLGAALVAAHPYPPDVAPTAPRTTARFAAAPEWAAEAVDRFELANRHEVFEWVARARLPVVATGDFHHRDHLATWKTLLPCLPKEEAIVEHLRSGRRVDLTRVEPAAAAAELAA